MDGYSIDFLARKVAQYGIQSQVNPTKLPKKLSDFEMFFTCGVSQQVT